MHSFQHFRSVDKRNNQLDRTFPLFTHNLTVSPFLFSLSPMPQCHNMCMKCSNVVQWSNAHNSMEVLLDALAYKVSTQLSEKVGDSFKLVSSASLMLACFFHDRAHPLSRHICLIGEMEQKMHVRMTISSDFFKDSQ